MLGEGVWNGGGGAVAHFTHDRRWLDEREGSTPLGMHHDLAAPRELVHAMTIVPPEVHQRPFAMRLNLG